MQGWAVPVIFSVFGAEGERLAQQHFHWKCALKSLPAATIRSVAGNGMHVAVVGSVLLYSLLFLEGGSV